MGSGIVFGSVPRDQSYRDYRSPHNSQVGIVSAAVGSPPEHSRTAPAFDGAKFKGFLSGHICVWPPGGFVKLHTVKSARMPHSVQERFGMVKRAREPMAVWLTVA